MHSCLDDEFDEEIVKINYEKELVPTQRTFTCSKSIIETLEKVVKYV